MTSEISNRVTDERKQLSRVEHPPESRASFVAGKAASQRVFKDYILSSEVFSRNGNKPPARP